MGIRRRNFQGINDKYMPWRAATQTDVAKQIQQDVGYLDIGVDPSVMNEVYRDVARERMKRYRHYLRFYKGQQWENEWDDGERKPVFNFCSTVVNKGTDFFVAKGFNIEAIEGNELVAQAMDLVWGANDRLNLFRRLSLNASITGDAFLYLTLKTTDDTGKIEDKSKWSVVITPLDPFFVFPVFSQTEAGAMDACMIQYPTGKTPQGAVSYRTVYITPKEIREYTDTQQVAVSENPFGLVPVVHFPNTLDPMKVWGQSDLDPVVSLNEEYNIISYSVRKIIKYHAEPTTIIYGARASKLEKGAKKVWSGLPIDARVENLQYQGDLKATYEYLGLLEQNIFKVSGIPSVLFQLNGDSKLAVSNTSGLAMRMMYQPLVDKAVRKQECFSASFKRTHTIIAKALEVTGVDLKELADTPAEVMNLSVQYTDPLPFDEKVALDADQMKITMGVTSKAALLRKYNPGEDTHRLTIEILADQVCLALTEASKAAVLGGGAPNLSAVLTSSIAVSEDVPEAMVSSIETSGTNLATKCAADAKAEEAAQLALKTSKASAP